MHKPSWQAHLDVDKKVPQTILAIVNTSPSPQRGNAKRIFRLWYQYFITISATSTVQGFWMTEEDILKDSDWRMSYLSVGKKLSTWDSWRQEVVWADGKLIKQKRGRLSSPLKNDESWDHMSELAKVDRQDRIIPCVCLGLWIGTEMLNVRHGKSFRQNSCVNNVYV